MRLALVLNTAFLSLAPLLPQLAAQEENADVSHVLIQNVKIFDGVNNKLTPGHVLIENNLIKEVGSIESVPPGTKVVDGGVWRRPPAFDVRRWIYRGLGNQFANPRYG